MNIPAASSQDPAEGGIARFLARAKSLSTNLATLGGRLSATASLLVINGVAAHSMSHAQFGLWSVLYCINLFTNGLDLGFQFTLGNRLAALSHRDATAEPERRETFLSIIFLEGALFLLYSIVIFAFDPMVPWTHWFKIEDPILAAETMRLMPVALVVMIATLPVCLIWTVFFAYGEIKLASVLATVTNVLQTIAFITAAYLKASFSTLILIYFLCNFLFGLILTCYVFIRRKWKFGLLPLARIFDIVRSVARVSFHVFFLTISSIISGILGPIASGLMGGLAVAGDFTLVQRLFSFLISSHIAVMAPVAPAVTRDSHAGNWDAVRKRLRTYVFQVWPFYFFLGGGIIWCCHPLLIRVWSGHVFSNYPLAALFLAWACLSGLVNTFSVFLNSLGLVKVQAALAFSMLLPNVILLVFFGRWFGLQGIVVSLILCLVPAGILWPFYTRRALRLQLIRV